jgi:arylformamidase
MESMMNRRVRLALALLFAAVITTPVVAGPVLDAIMARRQHPQLAQTADDTDASSALEGRAGRQGSVVLPPGSRVEKDLAYGDDPAQKIDVYFPADAKGAPVILMVHGGAWMIGDKANSGVVANKAARWLPKGYIVASPNYRMSRPPNPLDQADDVGRALAFVQARAASWGADPSRVVLMGHSSGAHLVALLTADPGIASRQGAKPWLGTVALDSAALNVVETMENQHARFYDMVFGSDRAHWSKASPFDRLTAAPKPMLLVCSSRRSDSCPAAQALAKKATSLGGRATVLPVALSHGSVNGDLGLANDYTASVESFLRSIGLP